MDIDTTYQYPFYYDPFFVVLFSTGVLFMISGIILQKRPPKDINWFYGYRTKNSMKNIDNWRFAQKLSAKYLMIQGVVLCFVSFSVLVVSLDIVFSVVISLIILFASIIVHVIKVEKKLKSKLSE